MRPSDRTPDMLRTVTLETGVNRYAEGSCLVSFGHTKVLVTASVEERVPGFMRGRGVGWVTAEYGMLPRATHTRGRREAAEGKQSGRTQEIQRLIGRSMRAVVDPVALGERQISIDCDVIQADGGTRTAAITGAWVALRMATQYLLDEGVISKDPIVDQVAGGVQFFHHVRQEHDVAGRHVDAVDTCSELDVERAVRAPPGAQHPCGQPRLGGGHGP